MGKLDPHSDGKDCDSCENKYRCSGDDAGFACRRYDAGLDCEYSESRAGWDED